MGRLILSLDTATVIDLVRGRSPVTRDHYRAAVQAGSEIIVSAIVMHELISGLATSYDPDGERLRMNETLVEVPVVDMTAADAEVTGAVAGHLRRRGRSIGDIDTLIAGQAVARGWTVVTPNVKHFGRVPDLPLIDWSIASEPLSATQIVVRTAET